MIKWKEDYVLGIEIIDEQHKKLFEIAERAFNLLKDEFRTDKYDAIIEILGELKDYTVFHFKSEEDYMMSIGYRKVLSHKVYHNDFIETINNVDLSKIDKNQDEYIMELLGFVVKWIDEHILQQDKQIIAV
ncbi:hemerythrin family protein [Clostridium swellfunianum]|uniref:bacteriohemerythrin n=1 Tax=Clostridium swellfunianum TaxID=1367462 RepID=UPI00202FE813|nr:hemerythrin family protein [Clostridium swellfunianum]MCM0647693.1 hemerythrin family protein [Clostridium swellfunianum]